MSDGEELILQFQQPEQAETVRSRFTVKPRDWSKQDCKHKYVAISSEERRVYCSDCEVELDPIQVLLNYAYAERELDRRVEEIRKHQQRERDAERARGESEKAKVPDRLGSLLVGDSVRVRFDRKGDGCWSEVSGNFVGSNTRELQIRWPGCSVETIPIQAITAIRVLRRAKKS